MTNDELRGESIRTIESLNRMPTAMSWEFSSSPFFEMRRGHAKPLKRLGRCAVAICANTVSTGKTAFALFRQGFATSFRPPVRNAG